MSVTSTVSLEDELLVLVNDARSLAGTLQADLLPAGQRVYETIGFAKVSASAHDAGKLGYLRGADGITMNRERLTADAKAVALELAREGYRPGSASRHSRRWRRRARGARGRNPSRLAGRAHQRSRRGRILANIIAGGALQHRATVSEQYLLVLERKAFLKLCGEPKTLERIRYTLKTGKPLRN